MSHGGRPILVEEQDASGRSNADRRGAGTRGIALQTPPPPSRALALDHPCAEADNRDVRPELTLDSAVSTHAADAVATQHAGADALRRR